MIINGNKSLGVGVYTFVITLNSLPFEHQNLKRKKYKIPFIKEYNKCTIVRNINKVMISL